MKHVPAILCLLVAACGTAGKGEPLAIVYPIDAKTADKLIYEALRTEVPPNRIERIEHRDPGYRCTFLSGQQAYIIEVYRYATKGSKPDGTVVDGFRFDFDHAGFDPRGTEKAERVAKLIRRRAREIVDPLPVAP